MRAVAVEDHDPDAEARRRFAVPPPALDARELEALDPADRDDRAVLIRAAHPELERALEEGHEQLDATAGRINPRLHLVLHEVVANQLFEDDPPEVWRTTKRLRAAGYEHHEVLHMLASTVAGQLWAAGGEQRPYDPAAHRAALKALPGSWERDRVRAERGSDPPIRGQSARADARGKRRAQRAARRRNRR